MRKSVSNYGPYVDHLWYPILVPVQGSGHCRIVEMQGCMVNAWNEYVRRQ